MERWRTKTKTLAPDRILTRLMSLFDQSKSATHLAGNQYKKAQLQMNTNSVLTRHPLPQ
jgi:hypothetical protein